MRKDKVVSIVLPTYNGRAFIRQTIESCLQQTYQNIQLIIIDDCSTDGTDKIIKEYSEKDNRILYHRNDTNIKLPASLNIGFRLAKGDYYTWISDDNFFSPKTIESLMAQLGTDDLIYSSYHIINDKGNIIDKYTAPPEMLIFTCAVGACFLYKKEIHETLKGYNEHKFRMEDYDFWLRACVKFKFNYIDEPNLYYYRKHRDSLTTGIYSNPQLLNRYKQDYLQTLSYFFKNDLKAALTEEDIKTHTDIFFNTMVQERNFQLDSYKELQTILQHFDKLRNLPWENSRFDIPSIQNIITKKEREILTALASTLLFENLQLKNKNPKIAGYFGKPIFWYYREYETLPSWYKKLGHVIKLIQHNRPFSLFTAKKPSS